MFVRLLQKGRLKAVSFIKTSARNKQESLHHISSLLMRYAFTHEFDHLHSQPAVRCQSTRDFIWWNSHGPLGQTLHHDSRINPAHRRVHDPSLLSESPRGINWKIRHWYFRRIRSSSLGGKHCVHFNILTSLVVMRSRVRFPALPWEFFPEGEDSRGDHGLGRLVEFMFKGSPGTPSSYITTHIGTT